MKELEKIYKALGNRRRLSIISFLRDKKESAVVDLAQYLHLSFRSTSRHLTVLRAVDIVEREQRGQLAYYRLNSKPHPAVKQLLS